MGIVVVVLVVLIAVGSVVYLYTSLTGGDHKIDISSTEVGGVMDVGEDVKRVSLGTNMLQAQMIHSALTEMGIETKLISTTMGFLGQGDSPQYLMYKADDEDVVLEEVDAVLD